MGKIETLTYDFTAEDDWRFTGWSVDVAIQSGQLFLSCTSSFFSLESADRWDFTESSCLIKASQVVNASDGSTETYFGLDAGGSNTIQIGYQNGSILFSEDIAGSRNSVSVPYSTFEHAWWRVRQSAGTIYWDTSSDGSFWTTQRTRTSATDWSSCLLFIGSGQGGGAPTPGSSLFDHLNLPTVASVPGQAFDGATVEVEFTTGNWVNITPYVMLPFSIHQGRNTEFTEIDPGTLTLALDNADGRFMPGNGGSPYFPGVTKGKRVRVKVVKGGVSYTRFVGIIQSWDADFPTSTTYGARAYIKASDSLARLAQRRLRSNFTEAAIAQARTDGVAIDAYEAVGSVVGFNSTLTNYSTDAARSTSATYVYSSTDNVLSFTSDTDASIGGIVTCRGGPASSSKTDPGFRANSQQFIMHLKSPSQVIDVAAGVISAAGLFGSVTNAYLMYANNALAQGLYLYDNARTTILSFLTNVPVGQFVRVTAVMNLGNNARSDWSVVRLDGTTASVSSVNFDIRQVLDVTFPGLNGTPPEGAGFGGIVAMGSRTAIDYRDSYVAAQGRTLSNRLDQLISACSQLPVSWTKIGTLSTPVVTGNWSGRSALDVAREMMRSTDGILWARARDSQVMLIGRDILYPSAPIVTLDIDGDLTTPPKLQDSTDAKPTRIDIQFPGGSSFAIDSAAEALGESRSQTFTTVNATEPAARAIAQAFLDRANGGLRISQMTLDLTNAAHDLTASLFDETSTLGGLYPTQRIRVNVFPEMFGVNAFEQFIQGWTETYGANNTASITFDLTPTPTLVTSPGYQSTRIGPSSAVMQASRRRRVKSRPFVFVRNR